MVKKPIYKLSYGHSEDYVEEEVISYEEGKKRFLEIASSIDSMKLGSFPVSYVALKNNITHHECRFDTKSLMEFTGVY